jgi:hypothetical protein
LSNSPKSNEREVKVLPIVPPVEVSRLLLLALVAIGAVVSITASPPLSSFAGGFAAGAGAVIVLSFMTHPRRRADPADDENPS